MACGHLRPIWTGRTEKEDDLQPNCPYAPAFEPSHQQKHCTNIPLASCIEETCKNRIRTPRHIAQHRDNATQPLHLHPLTRIRGEPMHRLPFSTRGPPTEDVQQKPAPVRRRRTNLRLLRQERQIARPPPRSPWLLSRGDNGDGLRRFQASLEAPSNTRR